MTDRNLSGSGDRDEQEYGCDCGEVIMVPTGDAVPCPKLGYHWREQCDDPPKAYR